VADRFPVRDRACGDAVTAADAGMATAEMAVALPVLVALLLLACGVIAAASASLRCEDAARLAARSAARGDGYAAAAALGRSQAPSGSVVSVVAGGGLVHVSVRDAVRMPGPLGGLLPTWTVSGTAVALDESTDDGSG
jgi:hypothetical protein